MKTTLRKNNRKPTMRMMTAAEIIHAVRKGASIRIPAVFWHEFRRECVIRCGDCSDIFVDADLSGGTLMVSGS